MTNQNLFLIGMPGCGKTTIGKAIAESIGRRFIDLDDIIVEVEGCSINEIFKTEGEDYFRVLEAKCLNSVIKDEPKGSYILAAGGGTPCFFKNMETIKENGYSIFLEVSPEEIVNRMLAYGTDDRPLLKDIKKEDLIEEIRSKLETRIQYYQQADYMFNNNSLQADVLIKHIKSL